MPPSLIRLLPIWIWSPSRIFGTPEMSAACAIDGSSRIEAATRRIVIFIGSPGAIIDTLYSRIVARMERKRNPGIARRRADPGLRCAPSGLRIAARPPHHRLPRQRKAHQHEGRGDL